MADRQRATPRTVLFDLDGTFADTLPALTFALNRVVAEQGRPPVSADSLRPLVSQGGTALVASAFAPDLAPARLDQHRRRFLELYRADIAHGTRVFPEVERLVAALEERGATWGIVTNKVAWLTEPLAAALPTVARAACIVSGDTASRAKPDPAPLLHACRQLGASTSECVYVGDARTDMEAAARAGMPALVALWGYLSAGDAPANWGADALLEAPLALLTWLDEHTR